MKKIKDDTKIIDEQTLLELMRELMREMWGWQIKAKGDIVDLQEKVKEIENFLELLSPGILSRKCHK